MRDRAAVSLFQLATQRIEVLPTLTQWLEQQPEDALIGAVIDVLWSMLE